MSALSFPCSDVDCSAFIARHAGETPTTIGALPSTPQGDALTKRIMSTAGRVFDGIPFVRVSPILWVTLEDLDFVEAALVLSAPFEIAPPTVLHLDTGLGLIDDSEPIASAERDNRERLELLTEAAS